MPHQFNVYCDESCHLENDNQPIMVLGAIWCSADRTIEISSKILEIKKEHSLPKNFEIKWNKVSPAKLPFYLDLINFFFENRDLHFRALIAEKNGIRHPDFSQTHDDWYYKMYYFMLLVILSPSDEYRIFVDIKDTRSKAKLCKLREVLCNTFYDFGQSVIQDIEHVRSHDVAMVQLADLLTGVVSTANRNIVTSEAKKALIDMVKVRSGYSLTKSTLFKENKFNLFRWKPQREI